ncbi:MAG: ATP-binding cassette domain-containing protein, partial [Butyricicoccus sp.]
MDLIACRNLNFTYPGCAHRTLRDISFIIGRGEFVVLYGKSGCGKSTLLRHLKKNLMPYGNLTGSVCYCGQEIETLDNRVSAAEIGFVQQNPDHQIVTDKVWHELAFGLESLGLDNRTMKRRVAEMASFFGIQTWFRKSVRELSGGQKQLLNLASIMVMQPRLLILDEPTSQLDPIAASDFLSTLKKINTDLGTTILISEHRLEELFPMADRVLVMEDGRIALNGPPRETAARMAGGVCADLFCGLPSAVKIAGAADSGERCPLTVREGRLWLENRLGEPAASPPAAAPRRFSPRLHRKDPKPTSPALFMKNVWFRYAQTAPDVLRGMELTVPRGELFAVLGGNGVGKTTVLKALTRQIQPDRGVIEIGGRRLDSLSDVELFRHGLALLPQ